MSNLGCHFATSSFFFRPIHRHLGCMYRTPTWFQLSWFQQDSSLPTLLLHWNARYVVSAVVENDSLTQRAIILSFHRRRCHNRPSSSCCGGSFQASALDSSLFRCGGGRRFPTFVRSFVRCMNDLLHPPCIAIAHSCRSSIRSVLPSSSSSSSSLLLMLFGRTDSTVDGGSAW